MTSLPLTPYLLETLNLLHHSRLIQTHLDSHSQTFPHIFIIISSSATSYMIMDSHVSPPPFPYVLLNCHVFILRLDTCIYNILIYPVSYFCFESVISLSLITSSKATSVVFCPHCQGTTSGVYIFPLFSFHPWSILPHPPF